MAKVLELQLQRQSLTERIDLWLSKAKWGRRDELGIWDYQIHTAAAGGAAKSLQLFPVPTLCDSMNYSPPVSSVHGILQARTLEWVVKPSSGASSQLRDRTRVSCVSCTGKWVPYH